MYVRQQREAIIAMLTAIVHISDIKFLHDSDTDGVYVEDEEILEIGCSAFVIFALIIFVKLCTSDASEQNIVFKSPLSVCLSVRTKT